MLCMETDFCFYFFFSLFSGYTMDVIASTGFGIQVDSQENPDSPLVENARKIFDIENLNALQVAVSK